MSYTIGEFARIAGLSPDTLRYYEKEGLLQPERNGRRRLYSKHDIARVDFIKRLKGTGMPIKRIADYIRLTKEGDGTIAERIRMLSTHRDFILSEQEKSTQNLQRINEKIELYRSVSDNTR